MDVQCGDHGICLDGLDTYSCQCDSGYTGALCDKRYTGKMLETILTIFPLKRPAGIIFFHSLSFLKVRSY